MQQLDERGAILHTWPSPESAASLLGFCEDSINKVARWGVEAVGGFRWRFLSAVDQAKFEQQLSSFSIYPFYKSATKCKKKLLVVA